jgi:crotonobetainyl-CoA:carnitine CoA-transferase CaiB-like acyl-CoA transferase
MPGPLEGLRAIDFGHYIAGPLAAVMLADQGADVVHVDPPSGPRLEGPADAFLNRNKRRIVLDLKDGAGRAAAWRLAETADVVIENFRPGVMDRLGLGAAEACAANPRLIYCCLPGFPAEDPRAHMRAWEGVLQAATANTTPRNGEEPPGWDWSRPTYSALPLPSSFAGYLGATSIVMALISRARTGRGQIVSVPLYDAMFTLVGHSGAYKSSSGVPRPVPLHGRGAGSFRCGDGRYVQFDTWSARHLTWFARQAGVTIEWGPEILDLQQAAKPDVNERLHARLRELFLTKSAEEWERIGNEAGGAIAFVRTPQEWLRTAQARAIGAAVKLDDPVLGEMWCAGTPVHLSDSRPGPPRARHLPGEDTADVLAELEARQVPEPGQGPEPDLAHPLSGMRVLDLGVALAGPTCGRLLSEYGAEVVQVSAPDRGVNGYLNRGKRSLLVDIRRLEGLEVYWRLVDTADVVVVNMPLTTMEHLGVGYDELRARRPDAVFAEINCYGIGGPWSNHRGWERQGQAVSGIMERTEMPSVLGPYNPVDIGTGVLATFATGLGLYHRLMTGRGQMVGASLCQTGMYHQAIFTFDFPGYKASEPRGYYTLGEGPLDRFYRASDQWFFLAARPGELDALSAVVGRELPPVGGEGLEQALESRFSERPAVEWVEALVAAGIAAHINVALEEMMLDPVPRSRGLVVEQEVDGAGPCTMPGISVRLSDTPARLGPAPTPPGTDVADLLAELGIAERLEPLERKWVIRAHDLPPAWPEH